MKNVRSSKCLAVVTALSAAGFAAGLSAHEQQGSLGKGAAKTDFYQVGCSDGTGHLLFHVLDAAPKKAPKVSAVAFKGSSVATTTDAVDADPNYSPEVQVSGGDGVYYVAVNKTGAAPENYKLEYHCESDNGSHTGTTVGQLQNQ